MYATLLNDDIDLTIGHTFVTYHMTEEEAQKAKIPTLEQKRGRKRDRQVIDVTQDEPNPKKKGRTSSSRAQSPKTVPTEVDIEQKQKREIYKICESIGLDLLLVNGALLAPCRRWIGKCK